MTNRTDRNQKFFWLSLALMVGSLLVIAGPLSADVRLQLDRNRITLGETVTLTFVTDDPRQSLEADFSALERDFEILDRRSETQLSIVNGRQTAVVRSLLTVEPRRAGTLSVPAFDFGNATTRPVELQVEEAPELAPGELPPVFIEIEVTPREGPRYVHAQLGLIVRVFYQQNLTEAAISQPEPSPASVRLLQETPYQAERGGERYRVLERIYAVFPERSGELNLPAMQLSGRLVERRDSSIWQPTVRGRRVTVESEPLQLQIEPRPAGYRGSDWQPARSLSVSQQISSTDALRVGEPVTRTVIIDAIGLEENMIAEPAWPELAGARIYPDQPQGITRDDGEWVLGHKEFRYAVVPEQEGKLELPELEVHWWDTVNNRQQTAILPAQILEVLPSSLVPSESEPAPGAADRAIPTHDPALQGVPAHAGYWRWLTVLFALLWLVTLAVYWRSRRFGDANAPVKGGELHVAANEAELLAGLRQACKRNDTVAARRSLYAWLRGFGPPGADGSLLGLAAVVADPGLRECLHALDSLGFRHGTGPDSAGQTMEAWGGSQFWDRFDRWRRAWQAQERERKPGLTDLYVPSNRSP